MNENDKALFNALCDLVIYHYGDLLRPKQVGQTKFRKSVKLLKDAGIIQNRNDEGTIKEHYDSMLEEYALANLPDEFTPQYDYWGAKCIDNHKGWNATKNGKFAGDSSGYYMFFHDFESLEQYTLNLELTPA